MVLYYLDTSIWLDFLEERDEPGFPKSALALQLIVKVLERSDSIVVSDIVLEELKSLGYSESDLDLLLTPIQAVIHYIEATKNQSQRARDLCAKRGLPFCDALHALIARDQRCTLITYDQDFQKLRDIIIPQTPRDVR